MHCDFAVCCRLSTRTAHETVPRMAGIALDGDGDRLVMVDGLGRTIDGDQLIYIIATARKRAGTL